MRITSLFVVVAAAACVTHPARADQAPYDLAVAVHAEGASQVAGGRGQLAGRFSLWGPISAEVIGRSGTAYGHLARAPDQIYLALLGGLAWTPAGAGFRPKLSLRAAHVHHATQASWGETPGANLAGDSSGGVVHRTGFEAGAALLTPRWWRLGDWRGGLEVELTGGALPSSEAFGWTVGLGLGVRFGPATGGGPGTASRGAGTATARGSATGG